MTGNIWMCSHLLDSDDLDFGKHEFITYKMGQEYYGMGEHKFANLVWKAGAVYKCGKLVLIRRDILEEYMRAKNGEDGCYEQAENYDGTDEC